MSPWRGKRSITAGRVRQGLQWIIGHVDILSHWNQKKGKYLGPKLGE
jgi:hypothetical protein